MPDYPETIQKRALPETEYGTAILVLRYDMSVHSSFCPNSYPGTCQSVLKCIELQQDTYHHLLSMPLLQDYTVIDESSPFLNGFRPSRKAETGVAECPFRLVCYPTLRGPKMSLPSKHVSCLRIVVIA